MVNLFGRQYSKEDLLKYCGNIKQIAAINEMRYKDGKADNVRCFHVRNGLLEYNIIPSKCLDISSVSYRGVNISYLCKPGLVSPQYGYSLENEATN